MNEIVGAGVLAILGLILGSFAGASVWRLRLAQLLEDKAAGEPIDKKELAKLMPLNAAKTTDDRSRCLMCGHILRWYDLIPLLSWAAQGGKCRYCKRRIGWYEPLAELAMATLFFGSFLLWDFSGTPWVDIARLALWLIALVPLMILFIYDVKWFLLPNKAMFPLIGLALAFATLGLIDAPNLGLALGSLAGAVATLSGVYWVLHVVSKGQWIGFGDVKLGLALALLLGDWLLAFLALFLSNVFGLIVVLPGMLRGTVGAKTRIPFGPFMILGALAAFFAGGIILGWYDGLVLFSPYSS